MGDRVLRRFRLLYDLTQALVPGAPVREAM
jgi:hypothetical protein